jgi:hypothetical protein
MNLPCCDAWRNHADYVQLWRALDGIRNHYPEGTSRREAIEMWMEVDEFAGNEHDSEEEKAQAIAAWQILESMREDFDEEHPVSQAMDQWLQSGNYVEDDG